MPAIHLARLKQQSAQLVDLFDQPDRFACALSNLFDLYSDRTHRPGQSGEPPSLLITYNLPKPVLRQVTSDMQMKAITNPSEILLLARRLWLEPSLEFRLLAASLLGFTRVETPEMVLDTIADWVESGVDDRLLAIVMNKGLARIRQDAPERLIEQIQIWLQSSDVNVQQVGLRALIPIMSAAQYDNLPVFFHMLSPFVRKAPLRIRPDILEALRILASHSPKESVYLLHQNLNAPDNPDAALMTRQILPYFPQESQDSLRAALRGVAWHP